MTIYGDLWSKWTQWQMLILNLTTLINSLGHLRLRLPRLRQRRWQFRMNLRSRRYSKPGMNFLSLILLTRKQFKPQILKLRSFKVYWPRFKPKNSLMLNRKLMILIIKRTLTKRMFNFKFQMISLNPRKKRQKLRHRMKLLKVRKKGTDRQWKVWQELPKEMNNQPPNKRNQLLRKSLKRY